MCFRTYVPYEELLDRVPLAIRHQEIPEPGFPYGYALIPFDRSFTTHHEEIDCTILQPSSAALMPPAMGRAKYIQPVPPHPQKSREGNRLQQPAALKEIDRSVYF